MQNFHFEKINITKNGSVLSPEITKVVFDKESLEHASPQYQ